MALQRLKVGNVIKPVAKLRDAHNKLTELIGMMKGYGGIVVKTAEGGISITLNPNGEVSGGGANKPTVAANELHFNDGTVKIDIDGNGIFIQNIATGKFFQFISNGDMDWENAVGSVYFNHADGTVTVGNGAHNLVINPTLITHDMGIKEIDVCSGGVAKKMLVIASAAY